VLPLDDLPDRRLSSSGLRDDPELFFFCEDERPETLPVSLRPVKAAFHIFVVYRDVFRVSSCWLFAREWPIRACNNYSNMLSQIMSRWYSMFACRAMCNSYVKMIQIMDVVDSGVLGLAHKSLLTGGGGGRAAEDVTGCMQVLRCRPCSVVASAMAGWRL